MMLRLRYRPWPAVSEGCWKFGGPTVVGANPSRRFAGGLFPEEEYLCVEAAAVTARTGFRTRKPSSPPSPEYHDISRLHDNYEIEQQREIPDIEKIVG